MNGQRAVPKVGDRVRYVIEGTVTGYRGGNRILFVRSDDGHPHTLRYDAGSLYDEDGVTLAVLEPAATSPP